MKLILLCLLLSGCSSPLLSPEQWKLVQKARECRALGHEVMPIVDESGRTVDVRCLYR